MSLISYVLLLIVSINLSSLAHTAIDLKGSYIGCYRNVSSTKTVASVGSVDECSLECKDENNSMIALKSGKECNCIERLDSAVASSQCNVPCDNNDACGGSDSYSVYKGKPQVMHDGFVEITGRNTKFSEMTLPANYTLETCAHFCLEKSYSYFQTIINLKCECIYSLGTYIGGGLHRLICDRKCPVNENEICDCYYEHSYGKTVIFLTRFQYDFQRGMSTYSHCKNRDSESFEIKKCSDGCEDGWRGDWCRERDCKVGNGGCGSEMNCSQLTVNGNEYVECVCPLDTVRNKWNKCEVMRKNIALHKPSYSSSVITNELLIKSDPFYLTDGLPQASFICQIYDDTSGWMAVDLLYSYHVGQVVAYNRFCASDICLQRMNKFAVRLNETFDVTPRGDIRNQIQFCGHGPPYARQGGVPMTIICDNFTLLSQFVIIQESDESFNGYAALAELEVYEAGCDVYNGRCGNETCLEVWKENRTTICCGCPIVTEPFLKWWQYILASGLIALLLFLICLTMMCRMKPVETSQTSGSPTPSSLVS